MPFQIFLRGHLGSYDLLLILRFSKLDDDVGNNPLRLNGTAARGKVSCSGQSQSRTFLQRKDRLDRALSEALRSNDNAPLVILNGSSHDLGSARTSTIDEDNQRIIRKGPLGMGVEFHLLLVSSSLHGNNKTRCDEAIRNLDRLIEKASRVIPQIQKQSLQRAFALCLQRFYGLFEIAVCLLLDLGEPDIAILLIHQFISNTSNRDDIPNK